MKILQIGKFYPIQGGVEKVMLDLTKGLSEKCPGVQCDMLCVAANPELNDSILRLNDNSCVICSKLNKKAFSTMLSASIIFKLRNICQDYDIIHIHHPDPMSALALLLSGYRGHVVLHWHSDILKQKLLLKFYKPIQNWLINRATVILGTTPKYLNESPHLKGTKKTKIALPIGIEKLIPRKEDVIELKSRYKGKHIVFALGRLVGYKGFDILIKAAKYLTDDFIILIGGTGPLKDDLQRLIDEGNLNNKVKLLGRIGNDELASYYGACDVYAMSSIWKTEAFGIVQIEAMSCGKPIVATKIPGSGVDWVNKDGISGINVKAESPEDFAKGIIAVVKDSEKYHQYSIGALKRYNDLFTLDAMVDNCYSVYKKILND